MAWSTLDIKSIEVAIVRDTNGEGTHNKGYLFGTDAGTENYTIFHVECHSDSADSATLKVRFNEGSALKTFTLFAGDVLEGPFAEVEVDAFSDAAASCLLHMQQH